MSKSARSAPQSKPLYENDQNDNVAAECARIDDCMENLQTNQLADCDMWMIWTFRHMLKSSGKYESCTPCWVDRFSLERAGGMNVLCTTSNGSQCIAIMYEKRSVCKMEYAK